MPSCKSASEIEQDLIAIITHSQEFLLNQFHAISCNHNDAALQGLQGTRLFSTFLCVEAFSVQIEER